MSSGQLAERRVILIIGFDHCDFLVGRRSVETPLTMRVVVAERQQFFVPLLQRLEPRQSLVDRDLRLSLSMRSLTIASDELRFPKPPMTCGARKQTPFTVAGLFAGIGGIEVAFRRAGHVTELLCEIDPGASSVLRHHFPDVPIAPDIRAIKELPNVDLVAAGSPARTCPRPVALRVSAERSPRWLAKSSACSTRGGDALPR